jgi:hypothetical protein
MSTGKGAAENGGFGNKKSLFYRTFHPPTPPTRESTSNHRISLNQVKMPRVNIAVASLLAAFASMPFLNGAIATPILFARQVTHRPRNPASSLF